MGVFFSLQHFFVTIELVFHLAELDLAAEPVTLLQKQSLGFFVQGIDVCF